MARLAVLLATFVFIAGFGLLTVSLFAKFGVTSFGVLSVLILLLLVIGVVGALRHPRR